METTALEQHVSASGLPSDSNEGLLARPLVCLVAALFAGLIGWGLLEVIQPVFVVAREDGPPQLGAPPELFERARVVQAAVNQKNAAVELAILGGLFALGLSMSESVTRRSWRLFSLAPVVGVIFGLFAGYLGGHLHAILARDGSLQELADVIRIHSSMLIPLGFGVGLGMGSVTAAPKVMVLTSLVGAAAGGIAAVSYTLLVSLAIPTVNTDVLLPVTPFGRLLWMVIAASFFGLIIPMSVRDNSFNP